MPKSKKRKNADFQKVKLKVGKKLPKGDNVTNLSFKTRQIQLTQRIRDGDTSELTTKRHLSVQDLLRQCDHHSCSSRVNAISGLKEVWVNHHEELMVVSNVHGYGEILKKLSGMLIDNEATVRHAAINLFKLIFSKLCSQGRSRGAAMIGGDLFKHFHAFLCCAMNHIHEDVRLDSLVLFDALLDTFPQFLVQHSSDLLRNLVAMISSPISVGVKGNVTAQKLSMNPESKLLAMKFRARVLKRIQNALKEAVNNSIKGHLKSSNSNDATRNHKVWSFYFDKTVRQSTVIVPQTCCERFQLIFSGDSNEMEYSILNPGNLEKFMYQSVPILLQCWREARATTSSSFITENGVSTDSIDVMTSVLAVIDSLFTLAFASTSREKADLRHQSHLIAPSVLVQSYSSDFVSAFMNQFPFSVQVGSQAQKKKKKKKTSASVEMSVSQQSLMTVNLDICHIMSCFCADLDTTLNIKCLEKIQTYIVHTIESQLSPSQCRNLVKIMKKIYSNSNTLDHCIPAFRALFDLFHQRPVESSDKMIFFDLFSVMFTTWDGWGKMAEEPRPIRNYHHNSEIESILNTFYASLPTLLHSIERIEENYTCIQTILHLLSHGINCFGITPNVNECLNQVLDPDSGLLATRNEAVQSKVLALLSQGLTLDKSNLQQILYSIRRPIENPFLPHRKSKSMACFAIDCITRGIKKCIPLNTQEDFNSIDSNQHQQFSNYLKFLFSLQIGMNKEELEALMPSRAPSGTGDDLEGWLDVNLVLSPDHWERHMAIASYVSVELTDLHIPASEGFKSPVTFIGTIEHLWIQNILSYGGIHIMSAYSLIKFIQMASLPHSLEKPSEKFCSLASLVIASVLASLYSKEAKSVGLSEMIVDDVKFEMVTCLTKVPCLLPNTWATLFKQSEGLLSNSSEDKQSAMMAMELLRSEDILNQNISSMETTEVPH